MPLGAAPHPAKCASVNRSDVVPAYWRFHSMSSSNKRADRLRAGEYQWAWEAVEGEVDADPPNSITLLVELAEAASDDVALAYLGAGPVESLLCNHGSTVVFDRVEGAARQSSAFATALRSAWFDEHVPEAVRRRRRQFGQPY
jgi:hypothetical protein